MSIEAVWNALPRRIRGQGLEKENLEKLNLQEIRLRLAELQNALAAAKLREEIGRASCRERV